MACVETISNMIVPVEKARLPFDKNAQQTFPTKLFH